MEAMAGETEAGERCVAVVTGQEASYERKKFERETRVSLSHHHIPLVLFRVQRITFAIGQSTIACSLRFVFPVEHIKAISYSTSPSAATANATLFNFLLAPLTNLSL